MHASRGGIYQAQINQLPPANAHKNNPRPRAIAPITTGSPLMPAASRRTAGLPVGLGVELVVVGPVGVATEDKVVEFVRLATALAVGLATKGLLVGTLATDAVVEGPVDELEDEEELETGVTLSELPRREPPATLMLW